MVYNQKVKELKKYNRICVLDTETTDRYWNTAAPVQIAALICDNKGNILDQFKENIKTTHKISPEASLVHGIYAEDLVNCRSEKAVLEDFCMWLKNHEVDVILTYNGEAFDRRMLNARCQTLNVHYNYFSKELFPGLDGYYDCILEAKRKNLFDLGTKLGRKWKLTLVAEILGIDNSGAHDAFCDVRMLKEIFFKVDPIIHPDKWTDPEKSQSEKLF